MLYAYYVSMYVCMYMAVGIASCLFHATHSEVWRKADAGMTSGVVGKHPYCVCIRMYVCMYEPGLLKYTYVHTYIHTYIQLFFSEHSKYMIIPSSSTIRPGSLG